MPVLKKANLTYSAVAGKPVQYMFGDLLKDSKELNAETLSSSCFLNNGKESFTRTDLPEALQLAPVFTFTSLINDSSNYLAAGDFYGALPYEGKYDALMPSCFFYNNKTSQFSFQSGLPSIDGEVRDAKWIAYTGGTNILVIARNNNSLIFLRSTKGL